MTSPHEPNCTLRERRSPFIDLFRTTPAQTVCPNFYVLSHANGCTFSPPCHYCYLKSTFWHLEGQEAFSNLDRMLEEVRRWIARDDLESYVLNTGNLSDSLAFEAVRPLVSQWVEVFRESRAAGRPHTLLLVTKGGVRDCRPVAEVAPCPSVIVSFSVNAPEVARRYEQGAAEVADRLAAARQLKAAGWRVRIRIDPMFKGWDYGGVIEEVRGLAPERVTLGTLRAEPHLLRVINDGLFADLEEPAGKRGLARYALATRLAVYRPAVERLRGVCPVGLCEETRDVWDALGLDAEAKSCNCGE